MLSNGWTNLDVLHIVLVRSLLRIVNPFKSEKCDTFFQGFLQSYVKIMLRLLFFFFLNLFFLNKNIPNCLYIFCTNPIIGIQPIYKVKHCGRVFKHTKKISLRRRIVQGKVVYKSWILFVIKLSAYTRNWGTITRITKISVRERW